MVGSASRASGMDEAVKRAGLHSVPGRRRPTLHDLRHTFASLLIAQGLDVVFVSRQLGHKKTSITLDVYADLFNRREHEDRARSAVEAAVGNLLETNAGDRRRTAAGATVSEAAVLLAMPTGGDSR